MPIPPPDWQLPPGVSRSLWHYLHNEAIARDYDAGLGAASLLTVDCQFASDHCTPPGRLIDLGCGTGRLLVPLAQRGYRVLGVDLSAPMLRVAGAKAAAAGVHIDLLQANLVDLGCLDDASFDSAICLFSTLGMIVGHPERQRVLTHIFRLLRPGGIFVLHVHNRWFNVWDPAGRRWLARDLWRAVLGHNRAGDRKMPAHGDMPALALHHFTRREILGCLRHIGFRLREARPVSLHEDGKLRWPRWFGWPRAYGYLIAAVKPLAA
jgi:SAM-dependent methyltransferase